MVGRYCCVPGCKTSSRRNPGITFCPFPRNEAQRQEWINLITSNTDEIKSPVSQRRPWSTPVFRKELGHKSHTVCGYHFNKSGRRSISEKFPTYFGNPIDVYSLGLSHEVEICDESQIINDRSVVGNLHQVVLPESSKIDDNLYDHNYGLNSDRLVSCNIIKTLRNEVFDLRLRLDQMENMKKDKMELIEENLGLKTQLKQLQECVEELDKTKIENTRLKNLLACVKEKNLRNKSKAEELERQLREKCRFSLKTVSHSSNMIKFYTGCENLESFNDLFEYIEPDLKKLNLYNGSRHKRKRERNLFNDSGRPMSLSFKNQLFMVLCRLKVGLLEEDLAYRCDVSVATISNLCTTWFDLLEKRLSNLKIWPSRAVVDKHMPEEFKAKFPKTRVIIDATELFIQKPNDFKTQSETWSSYKTHNTAKGLIGITPNGFISLVSDLVPGRMSDKELTEESGLVKLLDPGDSVMADRGFLIENLLQEKGVSLNMPPFLGNKAQLSEEEEMTTREIASLRIHVERVIRSVKCYHILSSIFPNNMHNQLNKIWKICVHLVNFCNEPLLDVKLSHK